MGFIIGISIVGMFIFSGDILIILTNSSSKAKWIWQVIAQKTAANLLYKAPIDRFLTKG